jgi:hypothetical protein
VGNSLYERRRTNPKIYYQPTRTKTQRHARVAAHHSASNASVYGLHTIRYADGTTREFYQIGLSANKTRISVYILGIQDKTYLAQTFGKDLGKASVTGYCIKFKNSKGYKH